MSTCPTCGRDQPRCAKCGASPWQAKRAYVAAHDVLLATCVCGYSWTETPLDRQEPPATPSKEELLAQALRSIGIEPVAEANE